MTNLLSVVHSDPDILGGTPVFIGTRVPVKTLLDYLAAGDPLNEFLDHFPSVQPEQAIAVLQLANVRENQENKINSNDYGSIPPFLRGLGGSDLQQ
ncbi:DUF433 domain-containing protein [Alkalinema pantanalense CENA528]|uniref:DUF433 domain-containing protein n=1 Tax=Alkalinema pantanalense TaxID=1620705 RepID=UPI003D6F6C2E